MHDVTDEHWRGKNYQPARIFYTVVPHKYVPPFAILALVQNAGGTYTQDATISLTITPSLPVKHDLIVGGG